MSSGYGVLPHSHSQHSRNSSLEKFLGFTRAIPEPKLLPEETDGLSLLHSVSVFRSIELGVENPPFVTTGDVDDAKTNSTDAGTSFIAIMRRKNMTKKMGKFAKKIAEKQRHKRYKKSKGVRLKTAK